MRPFRIALVASAVALTLCAALVFLVSDANEAPVEDMIITPEQKLSSIVSELAEHGATMSLKEMEAKLEAWRKDPNTLLDMPENARTQMLADMNFHTTSLVDDSTLCAKKDIIISKFDQLLKKLGGEVHLLHASRICLIENVCVSTILYCYDRSSP